MKDIKYKRTVDFLGRNGSFLQSGLSIMAITGYYPHPKKDSRILLEPITSKGIIGRAALEIPTENVLDVIKALMKHVPATEKIKLIQDPEWVVKT